MKFLSLVMFLVCLNVAIFILVGVGAFSGTPEGYTNPTDMAAMFRLESLDFTKIGLSTLGIVAGGLIATITKNYVFAGGIIILWVNKLTRNAKKLTT